MLEELYKMQLDNAELHLHGDGSLGNELTCVCPG